MSASVKFSCSSSRSIERLSIAVLNDPIYSALILYIRTVQTDTRKIEIRLIC